MERPTLKFIYFQITFIFPSKLHFFKVDYALYTATLMFVECDLIHSCSSHGSPNENEPNLDLILFTIVNLKEQFPS